MLTRNCKYFMLLLDDRRSNCVQKPWCMWVPSKSKTPSGLSDHSGCLIESNNRCRAQDTDADCCADCSIVMVSARLSRIYSFVTSSELDEITLLLQYCVHLEAAGHSVQPDDPQALPVSSRNRQCLHNSRPASLAEHLIHKACNIACMPHHISKHGQRHCKQ